MRKYLSLSAAALILSFSSMSMAQGLNPNGALQQGGFSGPGIAVSTVAEALQMGDDTAVVLEGKIEKSLGKEKYLFKDKSGSVTIEIDDDDWKGVTVTPQNTVVIKGEVEKDFFKTEIDVNRVEVKQ